MDDTDTLIVGYDIGDEYTQISCLAKKLTEPESVSQLPDTKGYMIPTALLVRNNTKEWLFGEDAVKNKDENTGIYIDRLLTHLSNKGLTKEEISALPAAPEYLVEKFFSKTLTMLRQKYFNNGISKMTVTTRYLDNDLKEKLYAILEKLGLKRDRVRILTYTECFMYFVLSQKPDIWANDVALFDYGIDGLKFYQMTIGKKKNPAPVVVNSHNLSNEFSYSLLNEEGIERIKYRFEDISSKLLYKRLISALYFTGTGFEGNWSDEILKKLCMSRRVFKGQNLYTKGACYAAKIMKQGGMEEFFFLSEEQIAGTISLKVFKDSKDVSVIFANAGEYYYDVDNTIHIILDNENTLDFTIKSLIRKDEIHAFLSLEGLPIRENKTICLSVNLCFADRNTAIVKVKDMGFGGMYKTSYRIWEFRLEL